MTEKATSDPSSFDEFDPRSPEAEADKPKYYAKMRKCPVAHSRSFDRIFISRDADIRDCNRNTEVFSSRGIADIGLGNIEALVSTDEPLHSKHRNLVNLAFTPQRVARQQEFIEQVTDELIDGFVADGECEIVSQFALILPMTIILRMMDLPLDDLEKINNWAELGILAGLYPEKYLDSAMTAMIELNEYLLEAKSDRRAAIDRGEPGDDLLTALMVAEVDGEKLSDEEYFFIGWQLMTAGHETTMALISNAMYQFDRHPDQKELLLANPELIDQAVEEVLRFDPPSPAQPRVIAKDAEFKGVPLKEKQKVAMLYGAANRDPERWENPDKFDITRSLKDVRRHLSFGYGIHNCLGAPLARLEARIAILRLFERLPGLCVDHNKDMQRSDMFFTRGWKELHMKWQST